ncbi:MAG: ATP-binding protein [Desulfatirhabdiaceae bacterium]|nr:ATP-binding protein [Desulfatirhabdiaceae bacterium]
MKLSHEVLLALAYVSQISDPDSVRTRFIESLNGLDEAFTFEFVDHWPPGVSEYRVLPIATLRSAFGYAIMAEKSEAGDAERAVFRSAFQFLAVILENRMQAQALESKNVSLLKEINQEKSMVRSVLDTMPVGVWVTDEKGTILMGNAAGEKIWAGARYVGVDQFGEYKAWWHDTDKRIQPEDRAVTQAIKTGKPLINQELYIECFDGTHKTILNSAAPLLNDERKVIGAIVVNQDITERKRAEEALRKSEEDLKQSQRIAHVGSWRLDVANNQVIWSDELYNMYGFDPALPPPPYTEHQKLFTPESWDRLSTALNNTRDTGIPYELELETLRKDGGHGWMWVLGEAVLDTRGVTVGLWGAAQDITERKKAEEERKKLQAQLNQAQKMESVGRLAGGVAHDFNNMLGIILGYAELALDLVEPTEPLHANLEEIRKAANRSADLTRQLLAFARKQTIAPKVLDMNETLEGMLKMLRRLIGEDIDLAWLPGKSLWLVKVDSSQIDQLLTNLCVNARDALRGVGKVTIETCTISFDETYCADHLGFVPGDYVMLAVSDNGCGMDKETLGNIFEPFFTTKNVGQGSGLGLATVYGIVKQNNGFINVYSEPDQGTTFKIYLPRPWMLINIDPPVLK